ncbi:Metallo-dependent phosphatase [Sparassis latifolia]
MFGTFLYASPIGSFQQVQLFSRLDHYPTKPRIRFRKDGTFKITVFSDLHFGENPWDSWGPEQDIRSTSLMQRVLTDERPDYVVLNGDLITGENTFRENSTTLIDQIVAPLNEFMIPFSSTYGNHDNEPNITHREEILREEQVAPLSYTRLAPPGVGGPNGPGNYWVPVYRHSSDSFPVLILWFFDSRGGYTAGADSIAVPDWVDVSVARWIQQETALMDAAWGPAEMTRGALTFVHIPPYVPSFRSSTRQPGLNEDKLGSGSVQDSINPSADVRDKPFWDALTQHVKNVHAVISGHDHGNEWCAREPTKNVIFCFNKHSGYGGYSNSGWGHGVRNIVFTSHNPKGAVDTWIRLEFGEVRAKVTLDANYN